MMARLIGIIGSTHGVRFSARPPRNTISRIASGPRPSNRPRSLHAVLGVVDEVQEVVGVAGSRRSSPRLGEVVESGDAVAAQPVPRQPARPAARSMTARRRLARAERDRWRRSASGAPPAAVPPRTDVAASTRRRGGRREAEVVVARLIAEVGGDRELAAGRGPRRRSRAARRSRTSRSKTASG